MNKQFLVNSFGANGDLVKSELWDSAEPKGLGFPFRFVLEKTKQGVRIRNLKELSAHEYSDDTIAKMAHSLGSGMAIKIFPIEDVVSNKAGLSHHVTSDPILSLDEDLKFKKALKGSMVGLLAMLCGAFVLNALQPKKDEALIPAQYAKIIMTPPKASAGQEKRARSDDSQRKTNVVQAFKSVEVQKSTQRLLNTGALKLLAKSDILSSAKTKQALSAVFDSNKRMSNTAAVEAPSLAQSVSVSSLGGSAEGKGGTSVGYGKGERASVQGQGTGWVPVTSPEVQVEEGLSKDEVGKVIHAHIAEVRYCYESALLRNATVQGKMVSTFTIGSSGAVKSAKVVSSTLGDPSLDQCIVGHLTKWAFPRPKGGGEVTVSYPFIFKALGK